MRQFSANSLGHDQWTHLATGGGFVPLPERSEQAYTRQDNRPSEATRNVATGSFQRLPHRTDPPPPELWVGPNGYLPGSIRLNRLKSAHVPGPLCNINYKPAHYEKVGSVSVSSPQPMKPRLK